MISLRQLVGRPFREFLIATLVGGLLFLVPLVVVVVILRQAMRLVTKLSEPLAEHLLLKSAFGIGAVTIVTVLLLILISFLAGIFARTRTGRRITRSFERSLLGSLPQYQLVKSMAEGLRQVESAGGVKAALVSIEGGWQMGYLLEHLENGWVAVFLPQAPTPMSGNVMYLPGDRVRPLNISMTQAMAIVKRIGVGSGAALQGVDMTVPLGA
jgi:uncharacterized membrane protein